MDQKLGLQQQLLDVIHWFHAQGWAPATSTNYSFRNPDQHTYTISRSGVDKGAFQLGDFMEIDAEGKPLEAWQDTKPSAETGIHTMLYQNPDIHAVLHTHSIACTVYSYLHRDKKSILLSGFEVLKGLEGITTHATNLEVPIFQNAQDIERLSREIEANLPAYPHTPGFLLAGHGLYAWGPSIAIAKRHIEVFEFLIECLLRLESVSTPKN